MLTKLEVLGSQITLPELPFDVDGSAWNDQIHIRKIDGLGPVDATINTSDYGEIPGAFFTGSSIGFRNIVLTVGLNPDYADDSSMEYLRSYLYAYFMPQKEVTLKFESTHLEDVQITGIVESLTPNIFSKDPEVQVSIICPDPDFVAVDSVTVSGTVGTVLVPTLAQINYPGSVETGFVLTVSPTGAVPTYNSTVRLLAYYQGLRSLEIAASINVSQYLQIDTQDKRRAVSSVTPTGTLIQNKLGATIQTTLWPRLFPGLNEVGVVENVAGQKWDLTYTPRYGGL